eukprot:scaffold28956_cov69-Phaeocystis_antarctica.AAC.4
MARWLPDDGRPKHKYVASVNPSKAASQRAAPTPRVNTASSHGSKGRRSWSAQPLSSSHCKSGFFAGASHARGGTACEMCTPAGM